MRNKETLEEVASKLYPEEWNWREKGIFKQGAQWQQEIMYSETEVLNILYKHTEDMLSGKKVTLEEWFNEFKKL